MRAVVAHGTVPTLTAYLHQVCKERPWPIGGTHALANGTVLFFAARQLVGRRRTALQANVQPFAANTSGARSSPGG